MPASPPYLSLADSEVQSWMDILSPRERIAQLIQVAAYSNRDQEHINEIETLVSEDGLGGLCFFQGHPVEQAKLTQRYQQKAKVPLLISFDGEWGLSMRLDETMSFPYQMSLGAMPDSDLIYEMGKEIARQCRRIGIHLNFAPDIDINNNPQNPVINYRSFGEDREQVVEKGRAYMMGMQDHGVLPCIKHFPGHGDTSVDSHLDLPLIEHDLDRLHATELYPFRQLIAEGAGSVMVSHLRVPALDPGSELPATLSHRITTELLQHEMGYQGIVCTDALDMKGVAKFFPPEEVTLRALLAGNDLLINCEDVPKSIDLIEKAVEERKISQEEIDRRCRKVLKAKRWLQIEKELDLDPESIMEDLHTPSSQSLRIMMAQKAITVLRNENDIINNIKQKKTALLSLQSKESGLLAKHLNFAFEAIDIGQNEPVVSALDQLKEFELVIITVEQMQGKTRGEYLLQVENKDLLSELAPLMADKCILCVMGNAYALNIIPELSSWAGLVLAYQDDNYFVQATAEMLSGTYKPTGRLPVNAPPHFQAWDGLSI